MHNLVALLTVIFVILKMVGVITWTWWVVFTPIFVWIGFMMLSFLFCLLSIIGLAKLFSKFDR